MCSTSLCKLGGSCTIVEAPCHACYLIIISYLFDCDKCISLFYYGLPFSLV